MKSLHLFAGIGGGILADKILGSDIVGAVEIEPYCRALLKQKQERGILESFPIFEDVRDFNGDEFKKQYGDVDVVCGGFPCQDISSAGRGAGITGEKSSLFFELARIVGELSPRYIFLENSPRIRTRGLDRVLYRLAELGFDAEWGNLSAGGLGAPHYRERWWAVCKRQDVALEEVERDLSAIEERWRSYDRATLRGGERSDAKAKRLRGDKEARIETPPGESGSMGRGARRRATSYSEVSRFEDDEQGGATPQESELSGDSRASYAGWWEIKPRVGRLVNEFPGRVDEIKGLGNAQVPIVAAIAFYTLLSRYLN